MNTGLILLLLPVAFCFADEEMLHKEPCSKDCPDHGYTIRNNMTADEIRIEKNDTTSHVLPLSEIVRFLSEDEVLLLNRNSFCPVAHSQQLGKIIILFSRGTSSNKTMNLVSYDTQEKQVDTIYYDYGSSLQLFSLSPDGKILSYAVTEHSSACRIGFSMSFIDLENRAHILPTNPLKLDHNNKDLMHRFYCPEWVANQKLKVLLNYWVCSEDKVYKSEQPREYVFHLERKD